MTYNKKTSNVLDLQKMHANNSKNQKGIVNNSMLSMWMCPNASQMSVGVCPSFNRY